MSWFWTLIPTSTKYIQVIWPGQLPSPRCDSWTVLHLEGQTNFGSVFHTLWSPLGPTARCFLLPSASIKFKQFSCLLSAFLYFQFLQVLPVRLMGKRTLRAPCCNCIDCPVIRV